MTTGVISIIIGAAIGTVAGIIRIKSGYKPTKKSRRRRYSSYEPVKTLPWFDKDYQKRQERKARKGSFLDF